MSVSIPPDVMYCPRCDRPFVGEGKPELTAFDKVKKHVAGQHPDYDPEWYNTYPTDYGN